PPQYTGETIKEIIGIRNRSSIEKAKQPNSNTSVKLSILGTSTSLDIITSLTSYIQTDSNSEISNPAPIYNKTTDPLINFSIKNNNTEVRNKYISISLSVEDPPIPLVKKLKIYRWKGDKRTRSQTTQLAQEAGVSNKATKSYRQGKKSNNKDSTKRPRSRPRKS
ncbi:unnamed protein product, partial [Clonostachys rhizophaga]